MPNLAAGAFETATFSLLASTIGSYAIPFTVSGAEPRGGIPGHATDRRRFHHALGERPARPHRPSGHGLIENGSPPVGNTFNYTYQVKSPLPAFGVTFDDPLSPSILLGRSLTVDNGTCTTSVVSNSVYCDIGSLGGQQSDISFSATPTVAGAFGNTATVGMTGDDIHPTNNSVTVTVQPK
jgi:hypothetical protein